MRDENGWPRLIVLEPGSPRFQLGVPSLHNTSQVRLEVYPFLPQAILECYEDMVGRLMIRASMQHISLQLTSVFSGIFPSEVQAIIKAAKSKFDQVFIIAEAQRWELTASKPVVVPYDHCPLIVAWHQDQLRLIYDFDLTTVENYVKSEFAV